MTTAFHFSTRNPNQFNPFDHPIVMQELDILFRGVLPFADSNKATLLSKYLRRHSYHMAVNAYNTAMMQSVIAGTYRTSATESLFAVNMGNDEFCNDLECYIQTMLR